MRFLSNVDTNFCEFYLWNSLDLLPMLPAIAFRFEGQSIEIQTPLVAKKDFGYLNEHMSKLWGLCKLIK